MMDDHKIETGPNRQPNRQFERQIDAALRTIGDAVPAAGMEGRILTRLAAARSGGWQPAHRLRRMPRFAAPLAGFASAGLVCGVIVVASVNHSHRYHPGVVGPPILQVQGGGVGAASAVHPAAPASAAPVPAGPAARGHRKAAQHGRARIGRHAKKAPGITLPAAPGGTPQ